MRKKDSVLVHLVLLVSMLTCMFFECLGLLLKKVAATIFQAYQDHQYRKTPFYQIDKEEGELTGKLNQLRSKQLNLQEDKTKLERRFYRIHAPSLYAEQLFVERITLIEEELIKCADQCTEYKAQLMHLRDEREELHFIREAQTASQPKEVRQALANSSNTQYLEGTGTVLSEPTLNTQYIPQHTARPLPLYDETELIT